MGTRLGHIERVTVVVVDVVVDDEEDGDDVFISTSSSCSAGVLLPSSSATFRLLATFFVLLGSATTTCCSSSSAAATAPPPAPGGPPPAAAGPAAHGISLWVHTRANDPTVRKAQDILDELLAVVPTQDRGVQKGTPQNYENFGVNVYTTMASALLELGFITNADDNDRFDRYFDQYAEAVAR